MGDQIKQTIVVQKGKQILNERGRSAFDIEATGLGVRKGSAGGPIMINMIRPFEIAIGTDMSGSISKLLHEKACLNSHLIAGSALAVTPIAPLELMEGNQSQLEMALPNLEAFKFHNYKMSRYQISPTHKMVILNGGQLKDIRSGKNKEMKYGIVFLV